MSLHDSIASSLLLPFIAFKALDIVDTLEYGKTNKCHRESQNYFLKSYRCRCGLHTPSRQTGLSNVIFTFELYKVLFISVIPFL